MKLLYGDYMKAAIYWRKNDIFDNGGWKYIKGDFSGVGNE